MLSAILSLLMVFQQDPSIEQKTSGWCSPNVANILGNFSLKCIGVDPEAFQRLTDELSKQKLTEAEKDQAIAQWIRKYAELEARFKPFDDARSLEAKQYLHDGNLDKAGEILDQILGAEDEQTERFAHDHYNRALIFELQFRLDEALAHLKKAYLLATANDNRKDIVEYGKEYSMQLIQRNENAGAEPVLLSVRDAAKSLVAIDAKTYRPILADIQLNLGVHYYVTQRLLYAEQSTLSALQNREQLAKENPKVYEPYLLEALQNLGTIYVAEAKYDRAESTLKEVITRTSKLPDPKLFRPGEAKAWSNLGDVYQRNGSIENAETAYKNSLTLSRQQIADAPGYEFALSWAIEALGTFYLAQHRPTDATPLLKEAFELRKELAKTNPGVFQPFLGKSFATLGDVLYQLGKISDAEENYNQALDILVPLQITDASTYGPVVASTRGNLANIYSQTNRLKQAAEMYRETSEDLRQLAQTNPSLWFHFAISRNIEANFYLQNGNIPEAEKKIKDSVDAYRDLAKDNPKGVGDSLTQALLVQAYVEGALKRSAQVQCAIAREAFTAAVTPDVKRTAQNEVTRTCAKH